MIIKAFGRGVKISLAEPSFEVMTLQLPTLDYIIS